jgi:hypothetical protein
MQDMQSVAIKNLQSAGSAPVKITKPGIYRDIDVADYHRDPCERPSFSQSIGKILIDQSPWHAKCAHPRLTPVEPGDEETEKYVKAQVIGDAAHKLMIGRGKDLLFAQFENWKTKAAQEFRDKAIERGQLPVLHAHLDQAHAITLAAKLQLASHEENDCFRAPGAGEVALIWQEGPIWFRCLVDYLHDDLLIADDMKTSGMSMAPHVLGVRAADAGWDIQAAMIERGLDVLDPKNAGRRKFRFIAQEQDPPHALNVMVMTKPWMTMGHKRLQHAIDIWNTCVTLDKWPGYPPYALRLEYPGFKESQWLNREIHEAAENRKPMLTSIAGG